MVMSPHTVFNSPIPATHRPPPVCPLPSAPQLTEGHTPKNMRALLSDGAGVVYKGRWASVVKQPDGSVKVEAPFTYVNSKGKGGGTEVVAPGTRVNTGDGKRRLLSGM